MSQRLNKIYIEGYKSIQDQQIELGNLNILIGANGAGKSNFISIFRFLRQLVEQRLQISVREAGGAERMLFYGSKETPLMKLRLNFDINQYQIILAPTQDDNLYVQLEQAGIHNKTFPEPYWQNLAQGTLETGIREFKKVSSIADYTYAALKTWRVYHFHDTSQNAAVKKRGNLNDNVFLREDAANLAAFMYRMQHESPRHYERIVRIIQMVVPMFRDFHLRPDPLNPESIRLEWQDMDSDYIFGASELSDGSLRFICISAMLLQPNCPDLILLDEPELGLHPSAIGSLAGLLQKVAHHSQIILSTQSPALVSSFEQSDIIVVENQDRSSIFKRLDEQDLGNWLAEYSLGELWNKNVIGGRP